MYTIITFTSSQLFPVIEIVKLLKFQFCVYLQKYIHVCKPFSFLASKNGYKFFFKELLEKCSMCMTAPQGCSYNSLESI